MKRKLEKKNRKRVPEKIVLLVSVRNRHLCTDWCASLCSDPSARFSRKKKRWNTINVWYLILKNNANGRMNKRTIGAKKKRKIREYTPLLPSTRSARHLAPTRLPFHGVDMVLLDRSDVQETRPVQVRVVRESITLERRGGIWGEIRRGRRDGGPARNFETKRLLRLLLIFPADTISTSAIKPTSTYEVLFSFSFLPFDFGA